MDQAPTRMTCTKAAPWRSKAAAIALMAIAAATRPAIAQDTGDSDGPPPDAANSYGPPDVPAAQCNPANPVQAMPPECMPQAYCDQYGCPDDFYDMPIWYGPVFYDEVWFSGPVYTRDWRGRRQYWIRGGWHYDAWHGPHPSWWNAGHYHVGPALGRNLQVNHGAVTNVRVWRGTQASTYHDSGGGRYDRGGFAGRETVPLTNGVHHIGRASPANLHAVSAGQRSPQSHFNEIHNSAGIPSHGVTKGGVGGHHGR